MATAINLNSGINHQKKLNEEIKNKYETPGREPDKALDGMFGLWQNNNVTIQYIREKKRRKKWL